MNLQNEIRFFILPGFLILLFSHGLLCQTLAFHHLNTSNGLSDNFSRAAVVDRRGFLWIGTRDGLNVYNGNDIKTYRSESTHGLPSNDIQTLFLDSHNMLWVGFSGGVSWMDERRHFHRIKVQDSLGRYSSDLVLESKKFGIILFTNLAQFHFDSVKRSWVEPAWLDKNFRRKRVNDAVFIEDDKLALVTKSGMMIVDYRTGDTLLHYPCEGAISVDHFPDGQIILGFQSGVVRYLDKNTGQLIKEYQLFPFTAGGAIQARLFKLRATTHHAVVIATGDSGLMIIDSMGLIHTYAHDPIDPVSISANNTFNVWTGKDGELVALTSTSGVSIGNTNYKRAGFKKVFRDVTGRLYDNFFNEIAVDDKDQIWLCGYDRLIKWDKKKNESHFYQYFSKEGSVSQGMEFRAICFDRHGMIWLSVLNEGIVIFDPVKEKFTSMTPDTSLGPIPASTYIHDLMLSSDGKIWACSNLGFFTIDPDTRKYEIYTQHPVLNTIAKTRTIYFLEDTEHNIWFGASVGLFRYNPKWGLLKKFNVKDSLLSNNVYGMIQDHNGAIYIASTYGFNILFKDKVIKSFSRKNGLRYDRVESFQEDHLGNIWVSNNKCLVRYDPTNESLQYFEENAGINTSGFRYGGSCINDDGELFWAPQSGVNFFYPEQLIVNTAPLKVSAFAIEMKDTTYYLGEEDHFDMRYARNHVAFHLAAVNLSGSGEIKYQYRLVGYDTDWRTATDITKVEYAGLSPGEYSFHLKASADGVSWTDAANKIQLSVLSPLWMKGWFIIGSVFGLFGLLFWIFSQRAKKLREKNEVLENELAISYVASSMNEQQTVESMLWDVAKNCIGRLNFEDCVIYLVQPGTKMLRQVAAHGPKGMKTDEIKQPLDIPFGKGIVGSVAASGKPELIGNTALDHRYIVDDKRRYSEIAVPIISDGVVQGVIDCEHSKKNFFTQKHLSMLSTIASLCANKIMRIQAEDEKQLAQLSLMDAHRKMSEVEMQALRAQMNPHFIFNCLNSINRYIVKSDAVTASLYLTRFSRLIRLILDNSNNPYVILGHELEALRLYIEMESLRFDKKFTYQITVTDDVNQDSIEIPPLIIQPYVENAIWHGLLHKEEAGKLSIDIRMIREGVLQISVEDNGVGRDKATELKSKSAITRKSLGMKLTDDRIALLNKESTVDTSIQIQDLKNEKGEAIGTRVVFTIPVY